MLSKATAVGVVVLMTMMLYPTAMFFGQILLIKVATYLGYL